MAFQYGALHIKMARKRETREEWDARAGGCGWRTTEAQLPLADRVHEHLPERDELGGQTHVWTSAFIIWKEEEEGECVRE